MAALVRAQRHSEVAAFALLSLHARIRSQILQSSRQWVYSVNFDLAALRILVERPALLASSELPPTLLAWVLALLLAMMHAAVDARVSSELGEIGATIEADDTLCRDVAAVANEQDAWWIFAHVVLSLARSQGQWPLAGTLLLHYYAVHRHYCALSHAVSLLPSFLTEVRARAERAGDVAVGQEVLRLAREVDNLLRTKELTPW